MGSCSRREFNVLVLAGAGTVLIGCNNGAVPDGTVTATKGQATLTFAKFPQLRTPGGSVLVDVTDSFPIVVVRTSDSGATALSGTCTHAGCLVSFSSSGGVLNCPCHNANFGLDGSVKTGPTVIPLPVYPATVGPDAVTVTLT